MNDDQDRALVRAHLAHLKRVGARPETRRQREAHLRRLGDALGISLRDATLDILEDWQAELARRLAPASVRAYSSHVRSFYEWAHHYGHVDDNPAAELLVPRVPHGRPRPIPEDSLRIAIACAAEPVRTWLVLAAFCGLRAGEIARLRREDVGDDLLEIDGKGGRPRTVYLPREVRDMLVVHIVGPGPIWRTMNGRPVSPNTLSGRCCVYLREVGAGVTLHQLRHRFATRLYAVSSDLRLVQDALGHASPATTAIYVAASAQRGRKAAERLARDLHGRKRPVRRGWPVATGPNEDAA